MAADTKERLALKRAQEHAKALEDQMAARNAAVSVMGQSIGEPMDFRPGPPPPARTGDVKAPPRSNLAAPVHPLISQKEEEEQSRIEAEAQKASYEQDMLDAGMPVRPAQQVNPASFGSRKPAAPQKLRAKKPQHPLLQQLRSEFGIGSDDKPPQDVRVADHTWTFVPLTPDLIALSARAADTLSETVSEHSLRAKQAIVCFSIIACDNVPIWEMLGLEPSDRDDVSYALIPKGPIRRQAAIGLYAELTDGMKNQLIERLWEAYKVKIDPEEAVASYTAYEATNHVLWACREPECEFQINKPRRYDAKERELPWHCIEHGTELFAVSESKPRVDEELQDPLA
jgi:hypothetical protein